MAGVKDVRQNMESPTMELGGRLRTIQFDLNAFAELENRYGTIQAALDQLQKGRMHDVRTILWAGLIHDEVVLDEITGEPISYNITPYQVGGWIKNPSMLNEVTRILGLAMGGDMPDPENMDVPAAPQAAADTPAGPKLAVVVPTEEEKAEEAKNG